mmetsp:Transcript_22024/g.43714  ORF Transcript_22024/g.43714 Transcript_22024/m.43714 type:complete len:170 (+) Transcript_22024:152-661(+)
MGGHRSIVELLLEANARVDVGEGPLLRACSNAGYRRDPKIVNLLLDAGANPNDQEKTGRQWTPLMYSSAQGDAEVVQLLLGAQASVDVQSWANVSQMLLAGGHTALMLACRFNQAPIVRMLLDAGASVNLKDENGLSVLDHVYEPSIKAYLTDNKLVKPIDNPKHLHAK